MATLRELNVQPGDVAGCEGDVIFTVGRLGGRHVCGTTVWDSGKIVNDDCWMINGIDSWTIISRAANKPKTWGEMTDTEKGALLLAEYEGENFCIEYQPPNDDGWGKKHKSEAFCDDYAYRIKPEPKVETVTSYAQPDLGGGFEVSSHCDHWPYRITFETINDVPDCATIKMEAL